MLVCRVLKRRFYLLSLATLGFLIVVLVLPSVGTDQEAVKQTITKHAEKLAANATIQEPTRSLETRSPAGPALYRRVVDGVVYIVTAKGVQGSGAVLSSAGWVVTNWHVVGAESIVGVLFKPPAQPGKISFKKEDVFFARVFKVDPVRDLALLSLGSPPPILIPLQLGSTSSVDVGQDVFAISHPEGLLWSYTEGVISQVRRDYEWKSDIGTAHRATMIQTQAVISAGSSGAPLFDSSGRLIGILVSSAGPGLNFAIAADEVRQFILSAIEGGG